MKAVAVTQAEADRILPGEQTILTSAEQPALATGEQVALWVPRPRTHPCDMKGHIVGTVTVDDALPIVNTLFGPPLPPWPLLLADHREGWVTRFRGWEEWDGLWADQLPLGDFSEGRWGWLLSDPQPLTKTCDRCGGTGVAEEVYPHGGWSRGFCSCPLGCRVPADPVPCKGRQGVFELPADVAEAVQS